MIPQLPITHAQWLEKWGVRVPDPYTGEREISLTRAAMIIRDQALYGITKENLENMLIDLGMKERVFEDPVDELMYRIGYPI